jgi:hypothetical protein
MVMAGVAMVVDDCTHVLSPARIWLVFSLARGLPAKVMLLPEKLLWM